VQQSGEQQRQQTEVLKNYLDLSTQQVQANAMQAKAASEAALGQVKLTGEILRGRSQHALAQVKLREAAIKASKPSRPQ
jgi:uncharacterized protein YfeS